MTPNAQAFRRANTRSPVIEGTVVAAGEGAYYRLQSGREFKLTAEECEQVSPIRWKVPSPEAPDHA